MAILQSLYMYQRQGFLDSVYRTASKIGPQISKFESYIICMYMYVSYQINDRGSHHISSKHRKIVITVFYLYNHAIFCRCMYMYTYAIECAINEFFFIYNLCNMIVLAHNYITGKIFYFLFVRLTSCELHRSFGFFCDSTCLPFHITSQVSTLIKLISSTLTQKAS